MTRELLESIFRDTLVEVDPYRATRAAVAELNFDKPEPMSAIAIGKGAHAMMRATIDALTERGSVLRTALVVATEEGGPYPPYVQQVVGDHPVPGARSLSAADSLGEWLAAHPPDGRVLVLISGGTTSLVAAPVEGVSTSDLAQLFERLLASGADIITMNAIRKRVLRFGAGRLSVALAPRRVDVLLASDVLGDDPSYIGSGPCSGDSLTAAKVRRMLERGGVLTALPMSVRFYLDDVHHQRKPETPKPGSAIFRAVTTQVVLSNKNAIQGAVRSAGEKGLRPVRRIERPLVGEARDVGTDLAIRLVAWRQQMIADGVPSDAPACTVAGGEATVTLGLVPHGRGGRCQELALAAARELHRLRPRSDDISLLVAGTDGRDGPTDAAGAIVDSLTWSQVIAGGRDPEQDLTKHDSYDALNAAGALVRTGLTGTNVNDVMVAVVRTTAAAS